MHTPHIKITKLTRIANRRPILMSATLFRMKGTIYRKFDKYLNELEALLNNLPDQVDLRLYINDTIKLKELPKSPRLEVFQFECPPFTYDGTFGTLVRMIPLLEWPYPSCEAVWVTDVDLPPSLINQGLNQYQQMVKLGYNYGYISFVCYYKPWIIQPTSSQPPMMAGRILARQSLGSPLVIQRFLEQLKSNQHKQLIHKISNRNDLSRRKHSHRFFPYGMDEFFTNHYLLPLINHMPILIDNFIRIPSYQTRKLTDSTRKAFEQTALKSWLNQPIDTLEIKKYDQLFSEHQDNLEDKQCQLDYQQAMEYRSQHSFWGLTDNTQRSFMKWAQQNHGYVEELNFASPHEKEFAIWMYLLWKTSLSQ